MLVIGGQRCGTTYLHGLLDWHPEITMARPARPEPKVFLSDELSARGREWYRRTYFAHATDEALLGEKSTSYIEDAEAPARVQRVLGVTECVVLLRDPVERAVSNWRFSTDHGIETRPLEVALRQNLEGPTDWSGLLTSVSPFAYLERGRYLDYLEPWLQAFPSNSHVFFLQELAGDRHTLQRLFRALGVADNVRPPGVAQPMNQSHEGRPPLTMELTNALREYFADSDAALSRRLGRALPWPTLKMGLNHG
jgi:hypothetical protein